MTNARLGFRRLFDAIGCTGDEGAFELPVGDLTVHVYLGPRPLWGIQLVTADRYKVPGLSSKLAEASYHADASQSGYQSSLLCELWAYWETNVPDNLAEAIETHDGASMDAVIRLCEARANDLRSTVDLVAGLIGLRVHRQVVLVEICENFVARVGEVPVWNHAGPTQELLDPVQVSIGDVFEASAPAAKMSSKEASRFAAVGYWLRRAWATMDPVDKFVALFLPIEVLLGGTTAPLRPEQTEAVEALEALVESSADPERHRALLRRIMPRPSLVHRFSTLAQAAQLPGWEDDIAAFASYNKSRNELFHRGDPNVRITVTVDDEMTGHLEDLVERYASYAIFGDGSVYSSSWRPSTRRIDE